MLTTVGKDTFTVSEFKGSNFVSLFAGSHYLGVGKDEKICIYNDDSSDNKKFILEEPKQDDIQIISYSNQKHQINPLLIDGNEICFKTNNATYFYYNESGIPTSGSFNSKCIFTISKKHTN